MTGAVGVGASAVAEFFLPSLAARHGWAYLSDFSLSNPQFHLVNSSAECGNRCNPGERV
jgi:hypothetical protein